MRLPRTTTLAALLLSALVAGAVVSVETANAAQREQVRDRDRRADGAADVRTRDHRGEDGAERNRGARRRGRGRAMCVRNVPATFDAIPAKVKKKQYLGARNRVIPSPRYTSDIRNSSSELSTNFKKWLNWGAEHFQSIQRKGRYLYITGGLKYADPQKAQLIVVEMGSRNARGPWSIPEYPRSHKNPHPSDRIVKVVDLDQRLWHAGGTQRDGDVLAVGLFGDGASQLRFYDISRPTRPVEIEGARVERDVKSYAAGLTTLADGHRLLVAWDDEHLDFYRSRSTDLRDGFDPDFQRVHKREVEGGVKPGGCPDDLEAVAQGQIGPCGTFQNVNLVTDCDGKTYLLGFRNMNKNILGKGGDFAALYEVRWPGGYDAKPTVRRVDKKHMYCYGPCNFGGGAGIYRAGSAFFIYGVAPYLHGGNDRVNFNEYALGSAPRDHREVRRPRRRRPKTRDERDARDRSNIRDHRGDDQKGERRNVRDHRGDD